MILPILAYTTLTVIAINSPIGYNQYNVTLQLPNDRVLTEHVTVPAKNTIYEQWEEIRIHVNAQYYGTIPEDYNGMGEWK